MRHIALISIVLLSILSAYLVFSIFDMKNEYENKINDLTKNYIETLYFEEKLFNEFYDLSKSISDIETYIVNGYYDDAYEKCVDIDYKFTNIYEIVDEIKESINKSKSYVSDMLVLTAYNKYMDCIDASLNVANKSKNALNMLCKISRYYSLGDYDLAEKEIENYKQLIYDIDSSLNMAKSCINEFYKSVEKIR